jgi:serine/threonine-protein phosphatase 2B regulatory subunit
VCCMRCMAVSVSEVEALYELFKKISSSVINDGLIHKVVPSSTIFFSLPADALFHPF